MRIDHPTNRPNFSIVTTERWTVAFSYSTPIAFLGAHVGWVVRENDWGPTTGKHLNDIDGGKELKALRLPSAEFETALAAGVAP